MRAAPGSARTLPGPSAPAWQLDRLARIRATANRLEAMIGSGRIRLHPLCCGAPSRAASPPKPLTKAGNRPPRDSLKRIIYFRVGVNMINIQNLTLNLNNSEILKNIDCIIDAGSITTIVGKSGAGKSTLLECIMQLQPNYDGIISIGEQDARLMAPDERARSIGMVFQQWFLFPHLTVLENCTQQLIIVQKIEEREADEKALKLLEFFEMADYRDRYSITLSGGQQQRVAIVRALCMEPKILCLDEPTSALDAENTELLVNQLREINRSGTTIITTSHDNSFIQALGGKKLTIEQGKLMQQS
jgi:ABC-type polar amino acid transport system ATPase subunit